MAGSSASEKVTVDRGADRDVAGTCGRAVVEHVGGTGVTVMSTVLTSPGDTAGAAAVPVSSRLGWRALRVPPAAGTAVA